MGSDPVKIPVKRRIGGIVMLDEVIGTGNGEIVRHQEVVGTGNTATVLSWGNGKVLKLFHKGYARAAIETEYANARVLQGLGFAVPQVFGIVEHGQQVGIVYERIDGESLLANVLRTQDISGCARQMAELHQQILAHRNDRVAAYKTHLQYFINKDAVDVSRRAQVLQQVAHLDEGNVLCHGDFHPGNIVLSDNRAVVLDFMNVCKGPALYDVARTVYLVQYTPVPQVPVDREQLLRLKEELADRYLEQMGVSREAIQDYIDVIRVARRGECPEETEGAS